MEMNYSFEPAFHALRNNILTDKQWLKSLKNFGQPHTNLSTQFNYVLQAY